jgi:hypothetical protein
MSEKNTPTPIQQEPFTESKAYTFGSFPLYEHKTPVFKEDDKIKIVEYGGENNYPDYLAYLYNRCEMHATIVNQKKHFIVGGGWTIHEDLTTETKAKADKILKGINEYQTLNELSDVLMLEWLVYGGYALLVEWNEVTGQPASIKVQGYDTIRTNKDKTTYGVSQNWTIDQSLDKRWKKGRGIPADVEWYPRFNPNNRKGKQILYVANHRPQFKVYPLPEYEAGIAAIETLVEIRNFDLNNVKSGFAAGTMMTLFNGEVGEEKKRSIERDIKGKVSGSDNAGEILLNFQNPATTPPTITALRPNDLADQFANLDPRVTQAVITAHAITSPMLVGIKTEGQLGGNTELRTAWELFYNTYIQPRQNRLEADINYMAGFYGLPPNTFKIVDLEPVGIEITATEIKEALSSEEYGEYIKQKIGLKSTELNEQEILLNTLTNLSPIVANKLMNSLTVNEIRAIAGLPPIQGGDAVSEPSVEEVVDTFSKKTSFSSDKLLLKLCFEMGEPKDKYEIVEEGEEYQFDAVQGLEGINKVVYDILDKNKDISLEAAANKADISKAKLLQVIEQLSKANALGIEIKDKNGVPTIRTSVTIPQDTATKVSEAKEEGVILETKWIYEGPKDSRNRDFCATLLSANRLYTRAEIDALENDMEGFNESVWRYRGGWYHNPATSVNTPQCRHYWKQVLTRRRA